MEEILSDKRFAGIAKDPKFRRIPKNERRVKIDDRFRSMFEDEKFTVSYTVDKRGRPINRTSTENLRKYYDLSSDEDDQEEAKKSSEDKDRSSESKKKTKSRKIVKKNEKFIEERADSESENHSNDDDREQDENEKRLFVRDKNDEKIDKNVKKKLRDLTIDYARGEGVLLTDSSSDDETTENEDDEEEEIEHDWGELDKEAGTTDEATHRLAVCNMDWDRIRAVDLLVLFNSFLPPGGVINSVTIYPSDFGLQRTKEEEIRGPAELTDSDKKREREESDDETNEEGSAYHTEKMRQYQLNRLKYYYAVLDCDSPETANKIYTECDGLEYESTSTKLDLRFIPDDMEFDHEPREICDKLPELSKYRPRQFTTTALQQVKVELTWDETNPERREIAEKINSGKLEEIDENDIRAYLASGTSDDESEKEERANVENPETESVTCKNSMDKYKSLLKSIEDQDEASKKREVELEFTWGLGTREKTEKLLKEKLKKSESLTPFEQYLEKRREKKKAKRDERKKLREENDNDDKESNSSSEDSVPSDIDLNDPYFGAEMKNIGSSRTRRKNESRETKVEDEEEARRKAELELLLLDKNDEEGKKHFDIKKIEENATLSKSKKKRLSKKKMKNNEKETTFEDNFKVDVTDPRFAALYSSHHYNIDPADSHYRRTKGTEALVNEKLKRRADSNVTEEMPKKQTKKNEKISPDLAALVKSVKRNTKNNISMPIR